MQYFAFSNKETPTKYDADVRSLHEAKSGAVLELWVQKKTIMMYDMISDAVQLQPCSELSYDTYIITMMKVLS